MSRSYWERWQWELQERRDLIATQKITVTQLLGSSPAAEIVLPSIYTSMLEDPLVNGETKECYVGRGAFGVVRLQVYQIRVAVKKFLPRSLRDDVLKEVQILSSLCHP